ncbi:transketolase family protein [Elusimicrobiota bacterium]
MKTTDFRDAAFGSIAELMRTDKNIVMLTGDMGAWGLDNIRKRFPKRFFNMGIAEQNMISVASGMALSGKRVFAYAIIPHITGRCWEQINLDVCSMGLRVIIIGVGSGLSYGVDGPTHHAIQDIPIMRALPGMEIYNPADSATVSAAVHQTYKSAGPAYIRLDREQYEPIYKNPCHDFSTGLSTVIKGNDINIIASGGLVHRAIEVSQHLQKCSISTGVIDLYRIKPVNTSALKDVISRSKTIVTIEEQTSIGGIGSIVAEVMGESGSRAKLLRFSLGDQCYLGSSTRDWAHARCKMDTSNLIRILKDPELIKTR